jgi:hypothetical protein
MREGTGGPLGAKRRTAPQGLAKGYRPPQRTLVITEALRGEFGVAISTGTRLMPRNAGQAVLANLRQANLPGLGPGLSYEAATPERILQPPSQPATRERVLRRALEELQRRDTPERKKVGRVLEITTYLSSPIVLDLDGNGTPDLSSDRDAAASVPFDLAGWGCPQRVQWLAPGRDGWLCEDLDGDGRIGSGFELFGTAGGFNNGFEKLALRDADGDGEVRGEELAGLSLWIDRNGNGKTDGGELVPVECVGLTRIVLPGSGLVAPITVNGQSRLCWDVYPTVFGVLR